MSAAEFDFGFDDTLNMLRDSVRQFSADEIAPRAAQIDASNEFPRDLWPKLGALGVLGVTVEEAYGGAGLGYLAHCIAMEEISRASASVGLSYGAHSNLCVNQIRRYGNEEQKQRYLPPLIAGDYLGAKRPRSDRSLWLLVEVTHPDSGARRFGVVYGLWLNTVWAAGRREAAERRLDWDALRPVRRE